jgi:hypothetical protein
MPVIYGLMAMGVFIYPESLFITGTVALYMLIKGAGD